MEDTVNQTEHYQVCLGCYWSNWYWLYNAPAKSENKSQCFFRCFPHWKGFYKLLGWFGASNGICSSRKFLNNASIETNSYLIWYWPFFNRNVRIIWDNKQTTCPFFYRQLGCFAFSLRFWPKIRQLFSNCPASDFTFLQKQLIFTKTCKN